METIQIADLQYLYDHPGKAYCRPCLSRLANGSVELQKRWLDAQQREFEESEATCSICGQFRTVVRAKTVQ